MDTFLKPNSIIKFEKPKTIGHFSIDQPFDEPKIRLDASNCKYFKTHLKNTDDLILDLKEFDSDREYYERTKHLDFFYSRMPLLLEYLENVIAQDTFAKCSDERKLLPADIICEKSFPQKIMRVAGDVSQKFAFLCTKFKGNIYICEYKFKKTQRKFDTIIARHLLCADKPRSDINSSPPGVAKFVGVFSWKLNEFELMYCGCINGIDNDNVVNSQTDFNDVKKVEIFVLKKMEPLNSTIFSKYVTPTWWSQLFLLNSYEAHIAEINDKIIDKIETIDAHVLLREYQKKWTKSSTERISFLNLLLQLITLRMTFVNSPYTVYKFEYIPQTNESIHYIVHKGKNKFTFLTDKYINLVRDL